MSVPSALGFVYSNEAYRRTLFISKFKKNGASYRLIRNMRSRVLKLINVVDHNIPWQVSS